MTEWEYVPTQKQSELECGARVFLYIREIADSFDFERDDFDDYKNRFHTTVGLGIDIAMDTRKLLYEHINSDATPVYQELLNLHD